MSDKKKKKTEPKAEEPRRVHKLIGNGNGFETDGTRYWLSPGRVDWMAKIAADTSGLQDLVDAVNSYAARLYRGVAAERRRWWLEVWKDIGIDPDEQGNWKWRDTDGSIERIPEEKS